MKPRSIILAVAWASVLFLAACSDQIPDNLNATPTSTPDDPTTRPARLERDFQGGSVVGTDEAGQMRTETRRAVSDFVKTNLPGWNIKGMSSQVYPGYVFSIDADLEKENSHMIVTFDTRKFFPESGDAYWLAVPANKYRLDRLHKLGDAEVLEQLRDFTDGTRTAPEPP